MKPQPDRVAQLVAAARARNKLRPFRTAVRDWFEDLDERDEPDLCLSLLQLTVVSKDLTLYGVHEEHGEFLADNETPNTVPSAATLSERLKAFGRRRRDEPQEEDFRVVDVPVDEGDPEDEDDEQEAV